MIILYSLVLFLLTIYSYSLVDPNITFVNNPLWTSLRNAMVQFGYHQPILASYAYIVFIVLLFLFHFLILRRSKYIPVRRMSIMIGVYLLFSYPLLSHDLFNYMFDAKIATFYHANPYLHTGLDFPGDPWLRFMHWTHRSYPYGPTFLLITLVPSMLSFGKFIIDFFLFKGMFVFFYWVAIWILRKWDNKWAAYFATHPLVIMEGLVNTHNDLIATTLAIVGIWYLFNKKNWLGRMFLIISGGIKYMTLPFVLLQRSKNSLINKIIILSFSAMLLYISAFYEIQPWYFLPFLALVPYGIETLKKMWIFFAGLLMSYYPYVAYGGWGEAKNVIIKHNIIVLFLLVNIMYLLVPKTILARVFVPKKKSVSRPSRKISSHV